MDKNDVVTAIAASLYASRATDDALRAEPPIEALANEAWDLYYKLERAVRTSDVGAPASRASKARSSSRCRSGQPR
jgi:hypothetical protein